VRDETVHFWIAAGFLAVMALHLFLHWRWIVSVLQGRPREGSGTRFALGLLGAMAILAVTVAPFGNSVERDMTAPPQTHHSSPENQETELVRGRTTLQEIEQSTNVPAAYLIEHLGLPPNVPLDEGVGKLGKQHGFEIDDVRRIVKEYKP